ncbi:hypothetical protein HOLleu_34074 [Holothuria leucospilota]|uniref:Endonuclease/exonuclease/phosphatase domain-containing protein n=1 Tax=Holothuria leucospilota TaxID=206669 RepID=A0A9Q0YT62_HOLLE|nr:hypothetical protein HOLleu_34074 [Holothuria leucospilota]
MCHRIPKEEEEEVVKEELSPLGRFIIIDLQVNQRMFTIAAIYAPNVDTPGFFVEISNALHRFHCETIICGGDLNVIFNLELDKKGGIPRINFKAREKCFELMFSHDLVDIWKERNPFDNNCTWSSNVTPGIHCRLDYFLISRHAGPAVSDNVFSPGFLSDHSFVCLSIGTQEARRGPGFWN